MKYFEFTNPYYALIKSETKECAITDYTKFVADDEGDLEIKEISGDVAFANFSKGLTEGGEVLTSDSLAKEFNDVDNSLLLIDGGLL